MSVSYLCFPPWIMYVVVVVPIALAAYVAYRLGGGYLGISVLLVLLCLASSARVLPAVIPIVVLAAVCLVGAFGLYLVIRGGQENDKGTR